MKHENKEKKILRVGYNLLRKIKKEEKCNESRYVGTILIRLYFMKLTTYCKNSKVWLKFCVIFMNL